jgi:hypothetical protein
VSYGDCTRHYWSAGFDFFRIVHGRPAGSSGLPDPASRLHRVADRHGFYDIAMRDFGLLLGALALARLSREFGPQPALRL